MIKYDGSPREGVYSKIPSGKSFRKTYEGCLESYPTVYPFSLYSQRRGLFWIAPRKWSLSSLGKTRVTSNSTVSLNSCSKSARVSAPRKVDNMFPKTSRGIQAETGEYLGGDMHTHLATFMAVWPTELLKFFEIRSDVFKIENFT